MCAVGTGVTDDVRGRVFTFVQTGSRIVLLRGGREQRSVPLSSPLAAGFGSAGEHHDGDDEDQRDQ